MFSAVVKRQGPSASSSYFNWPAIHKQWVGDLWSADDSKMDARKWKLLQARPARRFFFLRLPLAHFCIYWSSSPHGARLPPRASQAEEHTWDSPERSLKISTQLGATILAARECTIQKDTPAMPTLSPLCTSGRCFRLPGIEQKLITFVMTTRHTWYWSGLQVFKSDDNFEAEICFDYVTTEESQELTHSDSGLELYDPCLLSEFLISSN